MAESDGIPVADLLVATGPAAATRDSLRLAAIGIDVERLARILVAVNLRQAFRYRFFQADLRPANLVVLPGEIVSFVDYGVVGESDQRLAAEQLAYLTAVYDNDVERMVDPPVEAYSDQSRSELGGLRRDLLDVIRSREAGRGDEPPGGGSPAGFLVQVLARARAGGVELPAPARLLYRSVVLTDEVARRLDPRGDPAVVARDYLRVAQLDAKVRALQPERLESTLLSVSALARDSPAQLQKVLSDLADETFSLDVRVLEVPHLERNRNRRARMIAAAVGSISVALLLTATDLPSLAGVSAAWPLAIVLALVYAWLVLEWRRLR
jgi:ubiquinone biosynthesis protein